ncbi:DUF6988 family protein [Halomonas maura]|uniref:DUF6988 family protein n=1 Tax=Halomonas maura TaxID=117606 RepID=UPI0025B61CB2|nr:hypothetical protein [Halomonas maura]MDN3555528.1 hypothetical protein [Halomonas maura]
MDLESAISDANQRARDLHALRLKNDDRSRIAASLFAIAQQHQSAILILLSNKTPVEATAFSLLRLLLETTVRGVWTSHCATEEQVKNIIGGTQRQIDIATIFTSVERALSESAGRDVKAKSLYEKHWKPLSAYTHGYEQQVQRWLVAKDIGPNYSEDEVEELICRSDLVANLAFACTRSLALE